MKISVIIPHYDQCTLLPGCLDAVLAQTIEAELEIIVADNATPGGIAEIAAAYPDVRFLTVTEKGAACARNGALGLASGDYIAFTDADCSPDPDWLAHGLAPLLAGKADLVGGQVAVTVADPECPRAVEAFELVFGFRQQLYVEKRGFSVTANLLTRQDVARAIGPFTNRLSEDVGATGPVR